MSAFDSLPYFKKVCYNNIVGRVYQRMSKKPKPDLNNKTKVYTFKTPSRGINTISNKSERLYLKINIQV